MIKIPTEKKWYHCPKCGQRILIYQNTAVCAGIFIKCKKCGNNIEVKI